MKKKIVLFESKKEDCIVSEGKRGLYCFTMKKRIVLFQNEKEGCVVLE